MATQMATKTAVSQEPQKVLVSQKESQPSELDRNSCQAVEGLPPKRSSKAIVSKMPATEQDPVEPLQEIVIVWLEGAPWLEDDVGQPPDWVPTLIAGAAEPTRPVVDPRYSGFYDAHGRPPC